MKLPSLDSLYNEYVLDTRTYNEQEHDKIKKLLDPTKKLGLTISELEGIKTFLLNHFQENWVENEPIEWPEPFYVLAIRGTTLLLTWPQPPGDRYEISIGYDVL